MYSPVKPVKTKKRFSLQDFVGYAKFLEIVHYSYQIMYRKTYFGAKLFFLLHSNFAWPPCTPQRKLR